MGKTAVIVMDMLNPYEHPDAEPLQEHVEKIVQPLAEVIGQARAREDVLLYYVNDNYGDFSVGREELAAAARAGRRPDLVEPVLPEREDAFLTKVRHSAFYGTPLEYALHHRQVAKVVLTGQVTEQCVLYSALDAYIRHFAIRVPPDGVAAIHPELGAAALTMMERNMRAELLPAAHCLD